MVGNETGALPSPRPARPTRSAHVQTTEAAPGQRMLQMLSCASWRLGVDRSAPSLPLPSLLFSPSLPLPSLPFSPSLPPPSLPFLPPEPAFQATPRTHSCSNLMRCASKVLMVRSTLSRPSWILASFSCTLRSASCASAKEHRGAGRRRVAQTCAQTSRRRPRGRAARHEDVRRGLCLV